MARCSGMAAGLVPRRSAPEVELVGRSCFLQSLSEQLRREPHGGDELPAKREQPLKTRHCFQSGCRAQIIHP